MGNYIGRQNIYGLFEKQVLSIQQGVYQYSLLWQAGSSSSLLVVSGSNVLEPFVDYGLVIDGRSIVFAQVPDLQVRTYVVYLGRELSVARTIGIEPKLERFVGAQGQQDFVLSIGPVNADAIIAFVNSVPQKHVDDFTVNGNTVHFNVAPDPGFDISIYVHGVERFDIFALTDGCILNNHLSNSCVTNDKILNNTITNEKLNFIWDNYVPSIETFHGMEISQGSLVIYKAQYQRFGNSVKIKLDFECSFQGVANNRVRYSLPFADNVDEISSGSINITTPSLIEPGIQTWAGINKFDIQRSTGINYVLGTTWRFKVRCEYDLL